MVVPGPLLPTFWAGAALQAGRGAEPLLGALARGEICGALALGEALAGRAGPDGSVTVTGTTGPVLSGDLAGVVVVPVEVDGDEHWYAVGGEAFTATALGALRPHEVGRHASLRRGGPGARNPGRRARPRCRGGGDAHARGGRVLGDLVVVRRDRRRVRLRPPAVRSPDRSVPGGQAPLRGHAGRCRVRPLRGVGRGAGARRGRAGLHSRHRRRGFRRGPGSAPGGRVRRCRRARTRPSKIAKDCIQVLGGIGFTWEHDAHLYLRRAAALRQLLGGVPQPGAPAPRSWRVDGTRRHARASTCRPRPSRSAPRSGAALDDVAALDQERAPLAAGRRRAARRRTGPRPGDATRAPSSSSSSTRSCAGRRCGARTWPSAPGRCRRSSRTAPTSSRSAGCRPTLRGEISWCQLFSEPEAGSDLASLRTTASHASTAAGCSTARRCGPSMATEADWGICLARTDPDAPEAPRHHLLHRRHARATGIDIRPLREMTGLAMFNEVFLDDVFVPDDCVIGDGRRRLAAGPHDARQRAGRRWAAARRSVAASRRCSAWWPTRSRRARRRRRPARRARRAARRGARRSRCSACA